jgi:transcriptional regulator with XRE-family HTH domain
LHLSEKPVSMSVMQTDTDVIAGKVRGIATEYKLTQQDVAGVLGLERKAVSARWNGRVPYTAPELMALAKHLGVPIGSFFGSTSPVYPQRADTAASVVPVSPVVTLPDPGGDGGHSSAA